MSNVITESTKAKITAVSVAIQFKIIKSLLNFGHGEAGRADKTFIQGLRFGM